MNLAKSARCHIRMQSRWASASAVCMGISVFLRTVYYFGLVNLRDLNGFEIAMDVIFPMVIAAGYLVMIKALQLNSPTLFGGLIGLYAVNYLMLMNATTAGVIVGVLLVITALLFIATGLGYVPVRLPVVGAAAVLVLFRFFVVDLNGYILPLTEFRPVVYLPDASNLFGILAVALMAPALQLTLLHGAPECTDEEEPDARTEPEFPEVTQPESDALPGEPELIPETEAPDADDQDLSPSAE